MTTQFYPLARKRAVDLLLALGTLRACLFDGTLDPYDAANEFFGDLNAAAVIGNAAGHTRADCPEVTNITTTGGVLDGDDAVVAIVPPGGPYTAIVLFVDTGADGTSPVLAFVDNATGLPITTDGHSVVIHWAAASPKIGIL